MADQPGGAGAVDDPAQTFGTDDAGIAQRWISEIDLAERFKKEWEDKCKKIISRYRNEKATVSSGKRRFATLWSNMEVQKAVVYSHKPDCQVLRRYKDADPVARVASEVLERAVNFACDSYDFDGVVMKPARDDFLLTARGVTRVRYVPQIESAQEEAAEQPGEPDREDSAGSVTNSTDQYEEVTYEETVCDHIAYTDFLHNAARSWAEVRWVGFVAYMTRDELVDRFGAKLGKACPLDWKPEGSDEKVNSEQLNKAKVYEIWDKITRTTYWISKAYPFAPLDKRDDPLKLKDFFPCPRPMLGTLAPDSIMPVPEYVMYEDQAEEIDELTMRIGLLTDALRMVGWYAASQEDKLANVFSKNNENKLIPVDDWSSITDKGGIKGMVEWVPVDMVKDVLEGMVKLRAQLLDDVYHITGISDIMRGDTDPDETRGAQEIKQDNGSKRVREKQKEVARFARDAMRLKAEIISRFFSIETLKAMTNVQLLTNMEKQQITMQMQAYQQQVAAMQAAQQPQPGAIPGMAPQPQAQPQQPPPPPVPKDKLELMSKPSWEDVTQLLKNDGLRNFRIDVETDSTVEPDQTRDKNDAVEFATAIGQLLAGALPVVQAAPPMGRVVAEVTKFMVRRYRAGRELEDVIDQTLDQIAQMPPQPSPDQQGKSPEEIQAMREKTQADVQNTQMDTQARHMEAQAELMHGQQEIQKAQIDNVSAERQAMIAATQKVNERRLMREEQGQSPIPGNRGGMQ